MSSSYAELKEKIEGVKGKLEVCFNGLEEIEPAEKEKYPNPQLRLWTEDVKDLEEFTANLEEWLSQPPVSEAKRYLSDLKKWSESPEKISLEEVEKDWRFLSDSVEEIKEIHRQIEDIEYEAIKKKISTWVLTRITEKDIERAEKWATNANKFANGLKELENKAAESKLAQEVKKDAVKELLKVNSFDKDNKEAINKCQQLIDKSENVVKNKPVEIEEKAILKTYKTGKEIEESLSTISVEVGKIRDLLIVLEWIKEFANLKAYNKLRSEKQTAIKKNDLAGIAEALKSTQQRANEWRGARKREIDGALIRIERMSKSAEKDDLKKEVTSLEGKIGSINWNKPDLELLSEVLSQMDGLRKQLRGELITKLQSEDAISMIEEPEIIEDLGRKKGWDFERFIKALEVILRNGLIEIKAVEEK